jgi:hypothetical protein
MPFANNLKFGRVASRFDTVGGLHPDTLDYLARVTAAGGTVTAANLAALDVAIKSIYANGLNVPLKYFLCHIITSSFTGSLVPVFDGGAGNPANFNFTGAQWSPTLGLTGNGTNMYLNSNYSLATSLGTFSLGGRSDFHLSVWHPNYATKTGTLPSDYEVPVGRSSSSVFDSTSTHQIVTGITADASAYFYTGRSFPVNIASSSLFGVTGQTHLLANAVSESSVRLLRNGTLGGSASGSPSTVDNPTSNLFLFAANNAGSPSNYSAQSTIFFTAGGGLSLAQESALYNILNTLRIALGA